jgi:hypothetical protein
MNVTNEQMNELQKNGLVSDLAIHWSDVSETDRPAALRFLGLVGGPDGQADVRTVKTRQIES